MKTIKLIFVVVLVVAIGATVSAQTGTKVSGPKTESFKVSGNCDMCKTRIEKTAKAEGATKADDKVYAALPSCCHYERAK